MRNDQFRFFVRAATLVATSLVLSGLGCSSSTGDISGKGGTGGSAGARAGQSGGGGRAGSSGAAGASGGSGSGSPGGHSGNGGAGGACAGRIVYSAPGCGSVAAPVCSNGAGGACGTTVCGCDGQIRTDACGGSTLPFAYLLSSPAQGTCDPNQTGGHSGQGGAGGGSGGGGSSGSGGGGGGSSGGGGVVRPAATAVPVAAPDGSSREAGPLTGARFYRNSDCSSSSAALPGQSFSNGSRLSGTSVVALVSCMSLACLST